MLVNVFGAKCIGIDAVRVTVEVDIVQGIGIHLVGLADTAVKESLLRTITALQALDYKIPGRKIVINLAPADLHKSGSGYDLPIAIGIIAASGQGEFPSLDKYVLMGELGLDGTLRNIPGALPIADFASAQGFPACILPLESALEASEIEDVDVYGASTLQDVVRILSETEDCQDMLIRNTQLFRKHQRERHRLAASSERELRVQDIIGQESAKRGIEIAAAGGHNIIMIGPPGAGKSSLAKAMAGLLPPMSREEAVITSKIYSIAGLGLENAGLMKSRPFRAPHYSASLAAMIGGGAGDNIVPGEVTLAHNGVLFADEFGQMPKSVIEALRGPLEDRKVTISRLRSKVEYPASFMLVAASNPCPCGYYGEQDRCTCTPAQRISYLSKLSGPILDRIDIQIWMHPVGAEALAARSAPATPSSPASPSGSSDLFSGSGERDEDIAARILKARIVQKHRFAAENAALPSGQQILSNAEMTNRQIERYCPLSDACQAMMTKLMSGMGLSMRAYFRIIKVARTIADLAGEDDIRPGHLLEAAGYRFLDKRE